MDPDCFERMLRGSPIERVPDHVGSRPSRCGIVMLIAFVTLCTLVFTHCGA